MIYIYADRASKSAALLCRELRRAGVMARRLRGDTRPKFGFPVFNWGSTRIPELLNPIVNVPDLVQKAISKTESSLIFKDKGVPCVRITRDITEAQKWQKSGWTIFARRDGLSSGKGIVECIDGLPIPPADFYSRYFPKTHEYRVHVFNGQVIDFVEKRADLARPGEVNRRIRTHENGWVYAHNLSIKDTEHIGHLAIQAVAAVGLTFGAVDVLAILTDEVPRVARKAVVCEINTAPGLENTSTIAAYTKAIKEYVYAN